MKQGEIAVKPKIIALVGPTGSGKTDTAIWLSKQLGGEIVSMDSMQIYRRMDIGTAKPTPEQLREAVHHMIDVAEPDTLFTVSDYRSMAMQAIDDILSRGKLPILTGGTGLYLNALSFEMTLGENGANSELRQQLNAIAEQENGPEELHQRLHQVDPVSAARLHKNDVRRIIRALEVHASTGKPMSEREDETKSEGPYHIMVYGLSLPREQMYARINQRVDEMMRDGLVDEVKALLSSGIKPRREGGAMQAIGYKEIVSAVLGEISMEKAVDLIKQSSRRYAKRQWTWFRRDERTQWFDWTQFPSREALLLRLLEKIKQDLI